MLSFLKQLQKEDQLQSDNIKNELLKYIELNKAKLDIWWFKITRII